MLVLAVGCGCGSPQTQPTGPVSCNEVEANYRRIWEEDVRRAPEQSIELEMNWVQLREKLARECANWSNITRWCVAKAHNRLELADCEP